MLQLMINDERVEIATSPDTMLLNVLREQYGLTGSKEGCASGDCGACTVVVSELNEKSELSYRQINACITPIHSLHGKQVITVEHLSRSGELHPVQQKVVDKHGSQCGFCTPGIVMSLYALSKQKQKVEHPQEFLGGNLCRCTGYGPLIEAANEIAAVEIYDPAQPDETKIANWMESVSQQTTPNYIKPQNRQQLAQAKKGYPNARMISGGTDLALEITQQLQSIEQFIDLSEVKELLEISETQISENTSGWRLGAAVPLTKVHAFMQQHYPSTDEVIERLGSLTIRNRATLGGSLGHASPIGDIAPLLISLNGLIEVDNGRERVLYSPEEYITGYRETRIQPDQWISAVIIPTLPSNCKHAIYKVSKRYEDDIATVVLALNVTLDSQQRVTECILSAGGIAAKSVRLSELESLLIGQPFNQQTVHLVQQHVPKVIQPLSDVRGSASYRIELVKNLIQRFYLECNQIATRVVDYA